MSIGDIIVMLVVGMTAAYVTAPKGVTSGDYVGYMCLWIVGWTFVSIVVKPLLHRKKD